MCANRGYSFCAVIALAAVVSSAHAAGPGTTSLSNERVQYRVAADPYVVLRSDVLEAVIVDNRPVDDDVLPGHRGGYSGVGSLVHHQRGENLFVPAYAGLNFEHIHDGTTRPREILFEPRNAPNELRIVDDLTAELYWPPTPTYALECCLRYQLVAEDAIELTIECIPRERSFRRGYIGLFFASYIHQPESLDIHFRGVESVDDEPRWIQARTPEHGVEASHVAIDDDRRLPHDADFPLTLVFNRSRYRYVEPWYYGVSHDIALALLFREQDRARLVQSPSGGGSGNPAWDFQYFIPDYKVGQLYRFVMLAVCTPYQSTQDVVEKTADHRAALSP